MNGATGLVALRLGRRFIGVDPSAEYLLMSYDRLEKEGLA